VELEKKSNLTPNIILGRYNLFLRKNLFTMDFNWYKLPNLSHSFLAKSSPETFNNIKYTIHSRVILLSLHSSLSYYSLKIPVKMVPGQTDSKEISNFKLPKLKILEIEFFNLYSRGTCHSLRTPIKIFDFQLLLELGFISNTRLLNQALIPHVRKFTLPD
jgi:hypothetical protein